MPRWRFLLSHNLKIGKFKGGKTHFFKRQHTTPHCRASLSVNNCNMTSLSHIAARVEAAAEAYISVRQFANQQEWRAKFKAENVSAHSST